jgi:hypothetical protein
MNTSSVSLMAQLQDGSSRPATGEEIIAAARDHMSRRVRRGTHFTSPKATRHYLSLKLGTLEREVFAVIFLDKRHRLISYQEMLLLRLAGLFGLLPSPGNGESGARSRLAFRILVQSAFNPLRRPVASLDT